MRNHVGGSVAVCGGEREAFAEFVTPAREFRVPFLMEFVTLSPLVRVSFSDRGIRSIRRVSPVGRRLAASALVREMDFHSILVSE